MRVPLFLVLAAFPCACLRIAPATLGRVPDARGDTARVVGAGAAATASAAFLEKTVTRKDPPATLVASDFTSCKVGNDEFAAARVNESYRCSWQK